MVDTFLEQGFNYFDIAHGYLNGKSELALKECLTSIHNREEFPQIEAVQIQFNYVDYEDPAVESI